MLCRAYAELFKSMHKAIVAIQVYNECYICVVL